MFERGLTWHKFQVSGLQAFIKFFLFFSVSAMRISLCRSILFIGLCHDLVRISCNSWFYFLFDIICMSLDMICISKRATNFHPSISIKANGITSHYINMRHRRKTKKLTLFNQIILRFELEVLCIECNSLFLLPSCKLCRMRFKIILSVGSRCTPRYL